MWVQSQLPGGILSETWSQKFRKIVRGTLLMESFWKSLGFCSFVTLTEKSLSQVFRSRWKWTWKGENMQQIYRRTPMPKCDCNKVALQLYWNHTSAWVLPFKFAPFFQNTFSWEHLWVAASVLKGFCLIFYS